MKSVIKNVSAYFLIILIFYSCGSRSNKGNSENTNQTEEISQNNFSGYGKSYQKPGVAVIPNPAPSIAKIIFFIENSGSMKGYVTGSTQYVDLLANIANHPDLINIKKVYYLTSGISTTQEVTNLRNSLIHVNFNQSRSDLNSLFKIALDSTKRNTISIFVSDGIYDMCPDLTPLNTLTILGRDLRTIFIRKLQSSDFQTIVVKCNSNFNGRYFPGKCGCPTVVLNQVRPFYIWIFGESDNLKKYFNDEYLNDLRGYVHLARYFKFKFPKDIYKPNSHKKIGNYYQSSNTNPNTLENVQPYKGVFQFSIAVDFSKIPLSEEYFKNKNNYSCTGGFEVVSIDDPTAVARLGFKEQTHLIVVKKTGNPIGTLNVSLLNKGYPWISSTNISNDCNISGNTIQTFGFEVLNEAIIEAYNHFCSSNEICKFTITLKN